MKRGKRWLFTTATVLLLGLLASADAALPFKKVSIAKAPASTTSTTTTTTAAPDYDTDKLEEEEQDKSPAEATSENEDIKSDNTTLSKGSKLTGIPQIDYIWDPNLPRELRGYNLSSYPFLSTVPPMDEIHFKCEGLHDGFYASIEYKCQIYHHCVYGIRHDFLCANFTAFDQRTFICHFASDVDCEGSQKYWNRNDELYMATTTTSTSTSTTEAPATSPTRRRAQRPYQYHRRPVADYYDEEEYDEDYYEDVLSHRNKPRARPRPRKPQLQLDYDDEYDDKRVEVKPTRRNRNRYRDEEDLSDEDYDERRNRPRRRKPAAGAVGRGKAAARKPGRVDERRSFNEDEPRRAAGGRRRANEKRTTPSTTDVLDELDEYEKPYGLDQEEAAEEQTPLKVKTTPKPLAEFITPKAAPASVYSRPRAPPRIARPVPINEKKKYSYPVQKNAAANAAGEAADDDYYQEPEPEQEAQQEDDYVEPPRTTPRRRTAAPRAEQKPHPTRPTLRKPVTDKKPLLDEDEDYYAPETPRRKRPQSSGRTRTPPAPIEAEPVDDADYEEKPLPVRTQRLRPKTAAAPARKPVQRPRQPIVQPEEELEPASEEQQPPEQPVRGSQRNNAVANARRNQKLPQATRQRALPTTAKTTTTAASIADEVEPVEEELDEPQLDETEEPLAPAAPAARSQRPASVRVVKRPFLPSRGGSPYLPRGLQPVGVAVRHQQQQQLLLPTESTPLDMGSTISGVRLLEHGAPLLRGEQSPLNDLPAPSTHAPRTTLPPRSALPTAAAATARPRPEPLPPKLNLDELYENDYDVTLNDALDPTLKPLTPQHSPQPHHASYQSRPYGTSASGAYNPFNSYQQQASIYQNQNQNHSPSSSSHASALQSQSQSQPQSQPASYHSDSYFSSTDIRRRAIATPQASRSHRHEYAAGGGAAAVAVSSGPNSHLAARPNQQFYDDFAY